MIVLTVSSAMFPPILEVQPALIPERLNVLHPHIIALRRPLSRSADRQVDDLEERPPH